MLQEVIGMAIVDPDFRRSLLEKPGRAVAEFDLTSEEAAALMSIQASSFQGFATQLHNWIERDAVTVRVRA
jgi:hypothetical protein